jgi:hypothetical protein
LSGIFNKPHHFVRCHHDTRPATAKGDKIAGKGVNSVTLSKKSVTLSKEMAGFDD